MLFTTMTQFAVLGLVLVLGLSLGGLMMPRGTKWRTRYEAERDAHAAYRRDAEARMRDADGLKTNRDAYVRDLEAERDRLLAENDRLKGRPPVA